MFPSVSCICDKCKLADISLGHLFWSCSKFTVFQVDIFNFYSTDYNRLLIPDCLLVILGCSSSSLALPSAQRVSAGCLFLFCLFFTRSFVLVLCVSLYKNVKTCMNIKKLEKKLVHKLLAVVDASSASILIYSFDFSHV